MEDISSMKPQLLDLIPKERANFVKIEEEEEERNHGVCEDKKLELRLGPPGEEEKHGKTNIISTDTNNSLLCLSYMPNTTTCGSKRGFIHTVDKEQAWILNNKESSSKPCTSKLVELQVAEKKGLSPSAHNNIININNNTAVPNTPLQKRAAPAPVVGWPPIRSFRKNLASSSTTKPSPQQQLVIQNKGTAQKQSESCPKGLFVKINMDGVPIGRKVDLKAYDSYEKLSSAVDQLFRGLVAAQSDSFCVGGIKNKQEGEKEITGLLDGSGEYTLVYEDNEGDRMLVGDVPWHMFVTTVKRLRVLKSSEVSTLFGGIKQEKNSANVALR